MNRNQIRLIAVDMDGTLLNSRNEAPPDFEDWVLAHPEIKVVLASGRQYYTLRDQFPKAGDVLLYSAENGGLVFDHGENIFRDAMKREDVLESLDSGSQIPGVIPIFCAVDSAYMCHADPLTEREGAKYYHHLTFLDDLKACPELDRVIKVSFFVQEDKAAEAVHLLHLSDRVRPVVSGPDWIDIGNRSVNKGAGIRMIQKHYGISREESMAFGDYMNDYAMFEVCAESYAMGNACPEIKAIAAHETASNDEDGVMKVLRRM